MPCGLTPNLLAEMPFLNPANSIALDEGGAWRVAARDPARRTAIGAAARRLAEEQFSYDKMAAQYEALYRETGGVGA